MVCHKDRDKLLKNETSFDILIVYGYLCSEL